ncbi:MAG: hypothetical protein H6728_03190 [Myxococcales bacterium]|nr:hypothetical protein [Myxococcales bacterium]MCB9642055.1 hypothetical protein [Myxococcales bacterium]
MKTSLTSTQLDAERLAQIYRGELSQHDDPALYEALLAEDDDFEPFEVFQTSEDALELELHESEAILGAIMKQIAPTPALQVVESPVSSPSLFAQWGQTLRSLWTPILVGAAALFLFPLLYQPTSKNGPDILHKSSDKDRGAFFSIDVYPAQVREKGSEKILPFKNKMTLHPEDALLFHFVNVRRGYLYMLREDAQGRLETLYPFSPKDASPLEPGRITLKQGEQPMAYVLEPKMQGRQRFWLIHTPTPQQFPQDRAAFSPTQRALFSRADQATIFIRPR